MKYNSIGEQLIAKAKELDPSYKSDKFNDMSEALDIILKSVGSAISIFDITPYKVDESNISVEGYKALKEFISNNQGGMIKFAMADGIYAYFSCVGELEEADSLVEQLMFTSCSADSESLAGMTFQIFSNGHFTISDVNVSNNNNDMEVINSEIAELGMRISTLESWDISSLSDRVITLEGKITEVDNLNMRVDDLENSIGNINTLLDEINGEAI